MSKRIPNDLESLKAEDSRVSRAIHREELLIDERQRRLFHLRKKHLEIRKRILAKEETQK